jgi:putative acetyltransferase
MTSAVVVSRYPGLQTPSANRESTHQNMARMELEIAEDDPTADDVRSLLATHLAFSRGSTPPEYSFALDVGQLIEPDVTFFSARSARRLVGVAALKQLDETHCELKSMHTRNDERGQGVGRALVEHVIAYARRQGYSRMSLETGSTDEFLPARILYARAGFTACEPYGDYQPSPYNTFMTRSLQQ